jgi:ADP-ribose pyrophosphatase YjhB (NUDIX family)
MPQDSYRRNIGYTVGSVAIFLSLEWRNWQTHGTQNPAPFTGHVGSTPTSSTIHSHNTRPDLNGELCANQRNGMTLGICDDQRGFCLCPEASPKRLPLYPCSCRMSCEETAATVMAMCGIPYSLLEKKRIRLVSDPSLFQEIYAYLFVIEIDARDLADWAPPQYLKLAPLSECSPVAPVNGSLLRLLAGTSNGVAMTGSEQSGPDAARLHATRLVTSAHLTMPLVTGNGIILQLSGTGVPQGIILEKRASAVQREPGKWAVPAGFVAAHESAVQTVIRETREEIGLELRPNDITDVLLVEDPSLVEKTWLNWPVFYGATTVQGRDDFWKGTNEEVDDVALFEFGNLPPDSEIAFGQAAVIRRCIEIMLSR